MWLIHAIENMVFHLSSSLKIRKQTVIIPKKIMKVQGQKFILNKLVLLLSNIKHCWPFYNSLNPMTMPLIKSLSFLPTQQHTLIINFSLPLVIGFLIVVLLIIFVHPWLILLHIIKLILSLSKIMFCIFLTSLLIFFQ